MIWYIYMYNISNAHIISESFWIYIYTYGNQCFYIKVPSSRYLQTLLGSVTLAILIKSHKKSSKKTRRDFQGSHLSLQTPARRFQRPHEKRRAEKRSCWAWQPKRFKQNDLPNIVLGAHEMYGMIYPSMNGEMFLFMVNVYIQVYKYTNHVPFPIRCWDFFSEGVRTINWKPLSSWDAPNFISSIKIR